MKFVVEFDSLVFKGSLAYRLCPQETPYGHFSGDTHPPPTPPPPPPIRNVTHSYR